MINSPAHWRDGARFVLRLWLAMYFSGARRPGLYRAIVTVFAFAFALPAAQAQSATQKTFGAWEMRCEQPSGARNTECALVNSVTSSDDNGVALTVLALKTADNKVHLLRVLAPLGVLLPPGLGLKIDDTDVGSAEFAKCLPNGCLAEVILSETQIARFKTGKSALFIIFKSPNEGIGIPIDLNGFAQGLEELP